MVSHWLFRIGDSVNFINSSIHNIWGILSTSSMSKYFLKHVIEGDILWFIKSKSNGLVLAIATFSHHEKRIIGDLINLSMTNDELGWNNDGSNSDTEIHYKDLYNLEECKLETYIKGAATIRKFTNDNYPHKCKIHLEDEYEKFIKYRNARTSMI